jgi:energy-coupling factor transport system substrate-specific component
MRTKNIFKFRGFKSLALVAASLISAIGFFWPFLSSENKSSFFFWIATPLALILLLALIGQANLDAKSLALLAVLSAIIAALRPLGAGAAGIEPMWFLLILSSFVFGSSFGFLLGVQSMLLSAFLTGGFGPWLPYQIFAAGWIGLLAGLIPKVKRFQIPLIAITSLFLAELFGFLMDLQFWPWAFGPKTQLSYIPGAAISENFYRFLSYHVATSMAWNVPRAIFTAILIAAVGPGVMKALQRTARKAAFESEIKFT